MKSPSIRVVLVFAMICLAAQSAELAAAGPLGRLKERRIASSESSTNAATNPSPNTELPGVPSAEVATVPSSTSSVHSVPSDDDTKTAVPPHENTEPRVVQANENGNTPDVNKVLPSDLGELRTRLRTCLKYYYDRQENAASRTPWGIMHSLIAFGVDTRVTSGDRTMTAIGYLCFNGAGKGQRLFYTSEGKLQARVGPGYQGHDGQFLAMLAQSRVRTDYPIRVDGHEFTVQDLIEHEKLTCRPNSELTFKLIALSNYLQSDAEWQDNQGRPWSIERLIKEELAQPIIGETCGGTHRMMGFTYAVRAREKRGEPITGQWLRAKKYLDEFHEYTFKLQNEDGSFSTNWFEGRGDWGGRDRRLRTTGHIFEWLVYSLPKEQLTDTRVVKALDYLTELLWENREHSWEIGPQGHALHALVIYDQRAFGAKPGLGGPQVDSELARTDE